MAWQKKLLSNMTPVGKPGELPELVRGWAKNELGRAVLADPAGHPNGPRPCPPEIAGYGWFEVTPHTIGRVESLQIDDRLERKARAQERSGDDIGAVKTRLQKKG